MGIKKTFETILNGINNAITDFTTLEVTTITGEINRIANDKGQFDSEGLVKTINNPNGDINQNLQIVAHTRIDFDNDTILFVKSDLNDAEKELFKLHNESIENAKKSRQEMIKFMSDVILGD